MIKKQNDSNSLEKKFKITIPYKTVENKMEEDFNNLSKTLKVAGFRPGKVPISFVKGKYFNQVLTNVSEKLIREEGNKKFDKEGYRIASQPKVTLLSEFKEKIDLEAEFIFEVLPDFALKDFKTLKLDNYVSKIEDGDIKKVIKKLFNDYKEFEKINVKRKSTKQDRLLISFKGYIDGKLFDGGSAENQAFDIGQNNYLPEFEENLIDKEMHEEVTINLIFPKNYQKKDLQEKKARFVVTINEILQAKPLTDEDELANKVGVKDKSELKQKIKKELEKYSKDLSFSILKNTIIRKIESQYDFMLPKTLVDNEYNLIINNEQNNQERNDKERKEFEEKVKKDAKTKVKLGLIISEIGIKNKITVTNQELETEIAKICMQYPGKEKEIIDYYKKNPAQMKSLKGPVFENKVINFIIENANVTDINITSDELNKKISKIEEEASKTK